MKPLEPNRLDQVWRVHRANDAWKAQWNTRLVWSCVAAVAAHVVVIVIGPDWEVTSPALDPELDSDGMAWISLFAPPSTGRGASPGASPIAHATDSIPPVARVGERADGAQMTAEEYSAAIRQRVLRGERLKPTLAEPEPDPEPERNDASEGPQELDGDGVNSPSIGGSASTAELSMLPEATSIDLSRLAALQPDIVLAGSEAWVLVRNPREVMRFMRESFSRLSLEPGVSGSVSVVIFINEQGSVEMTDIGKSSGIPDVDEAFLKLFREVVAFRPARYRGVPVPRSAVFEVPFPW